MYSVASLFNESDEFFQWFCSIELSWKPYNCLAALEAQNFSITVELIFYIKEYQKINPVPKNIKIVLF
jgi:hypothetical protein